MTPEEVVRVIQQTPMPSLQQVHPRVQKALETDGETHVLTLLMKDVIERGIKGIHIQTRYGVTRDFVHKIHFGKRRPGGPKISGKSSKSPPLPHNPQSFQDHYHPPKEK